MKKLYKSQTNRILTGILGGIAEYFGTDATMVRLLFMVLLVFTGFFPFGLMYLLAYFIIPERPPLDTVSNQ